MDILELLHYTFFQHALLQEAYLPALPVVLSEHTL